MYDLKDLKGIPCEEVARRYGIHLSERGGRFWGKLRESEKTASFSISKDKNMWYDFGYKKGGSVIDLVAELEGISSTEAINRLAEEFGFEKEIKTGWRPLTDQQYRELGIQPEKATMNFGFNLESEPIEVVQRRSEKYNMSVRELAENHPAVYNRMVVKVAMESIQTLKEAYEVRMFLFHEPDAKSEHKIFYKDMAEPDAIAINRKVELLQRALKDSYRQLNHLKVDFENDFKEFFDKDAIIKRNAVSPEDIQVKNRMVKIYKNLFGDNLIEKFSVDQAVALRDINKIISNNDNKYLPTDGIKHTHKLIGNKIDELQKCYQEEISKKKDFAVNDRVGIQDWEDRCNAFDTQLARYRDIYNKCDVVVNAIRDANLSIKVESSATSVKTQLHEFEA